MKKALNRKTDLANKNNRYVVERGNINGRPTLKVTDRYLSPVVINIYEFAFTGHPETYGYGSILIDKIIHSFSIANEKLPSGSKDFI